MTAKSHGLDEFSKTLETTLIESEEYDHERIFKEAEKTKAGITESQPPRYISKTDFYIQTRDQKPQLIKISKRRLIDFFENQSEIKEFIKKNTLKVSKIESIISIIEFADKSINL